MDFYNSFLYQALQLALFLCALWYLNERARYIISFTLFGLSYTLIVPILVIPIILFRIGEPTNMSHGRIIYHMLASIFGLSFDLRDTHKIGNDIAVVVLNHQSSLDTWVAHELFILRKRIKATMKREVLYFGLAGIYFWMCGMIFVYRKGAEEAIQEFNEKADECLQKDKCFLVMFPEGTRAGPATKTFLSFKKGAFHVAIRNQVPIIPIVVSPYYFIDNGRWTSRSAKVVLKVLDPIPTVGMIPDDVDDLVNRTRSAMEETYKELRAELST